MKVTDVHSGCLDRQVTERVNIENFQGCESAKNAIQEMGRRLKGTRMEVPPPFISLQTSRGVKRR